MHRNRVSARPKSSSSAMPRFPNRTAAVAVNRLSLDDDEDNEICPVCDGDCTCNNRPRPLLPSNNGNAYFVATPTASSVSSGHALEAQPLKIKLTVPPSIQNKARYLAPAQKNSRIDSSSSRVAGSSSVSSRLASASSTAGHRQHTSSDAVGPQRRRRPPKPAAISIVDDGATNALSDRKIRGNAVDTLPQPQSHLSSHTYAQRPVTSRPARARVQTPPKSNLVASRQTSKSQAKGTIATRSASVKRKPDSVDGLTDSDIQPTSHNDDGKDGSSGRFPTFVSADGLTSEASDSSESESDSDTSGFGSDLSLAEEEENYIVAEQRRHDKARVRRELLGDDVPKHKDSNNSWVIRPRKKSVGLSDVDMEGDTDDISEEDDDDDEDEDEEMEEDEEDETDGRAARVYTGLATGWSDDEESSFDADLFFANLTDVSSDDGSSDSDSCQHDSASDPLANSVTSLRSVDFEVTEAWDGQVVFTNGLTDGNGVLDLAFEANAARLLASDTASVSHESDVEMHASDDTHGGFDDDDSELGVSDGETTEEELVDEQGLPTSRAMRLLRWPTSVSSINPMSTVSPTVSPAPFSRRYPPSTLLESPRPADILAGKVFWEDADQLQQDSADGSAGESPRPVVMPIMGQFSLEVNASQKTAILTGVNKDVPSPYPRPGHRRRFSSSAGSFSSMDLRGRTAKLSIYPLLPPPSDEPSSETPPVIGLGEPIKLDDVLDSNFLDSGPEMSALPDSEGEHKLAESLSRWDRVPIDAFRLTRESATSASDVPTSPGWTSEPCQSSIPEVRSYGNALKSSPLHAMLWNDKSGVREDPRKSKGVFISPVLLPVRDGDRTPTHVPYHHELHSNHRQQHTPFKNRKESRREMKMMKRKTHAPNHQYYDHRQRHHRRNHHPNMKSRSNASVQRTYFSSPTNAPALNI